MCELVKCSVLVLAFLTNDTVATFRTRIDHADFDSGGSGGDAGRVFDVWDAAGSSSIFCELPEDAAAIFSLPRAKVAGD